MAEKYYSIITNRGKALEAESSASGTPVLFKKFVVGDGNGQFVTPNPARTTLVNEVYRADIASLDVSPEQENQWIAHLVLPADVGGFTVREAGLLTDAGELYAISNCAAIEKPENGVSINIQFRLAVSETAQINLIVATGDGLFLRQDANLSDVKDVERTRKNLGLKGASLLDVGIQKDTVAAGDDPRITNAVQRGGDEMTGDLTLQNLKAKGTGFIEKRGNVVNADNTNSTNGLRLIGRDDLFADIYHFEQPGVRHCLGIHVANGGAEGWFEFWHNNEFHIGNAIIAPDGNVYGTKWGGWLYDWMINQLAARDNNIATRATIDWVNTYFVTDIRLSGEARLGSGWYISVPGSCVMTGLDVAGDGNATTDIGYRALQKCINGQWYNVWTL